MDSEYISKKEIYDCLDKLESITGTSREWEDRDQVVVSAVKSVVKAVRAVVRLAKEQDVVPVVHGKDIYYTVHGHCEFKCSVCGCELSMVYGGENDFVMDGGYFNYCPNCGARMDGDGDV